eukprot:gnl/MRDRNA2_/MRDRNA2_38782_c0_seq1.p1 gnl/MRDRNA2_/MRDRNA2_38782_c0~~gnl/MRDRNA2_/MRDRNA2_38782_c0_seq1.p1  ORF type:complete len:713 (-),score=124.54 gnl/MRDRNA2_/MRDRNA2_38782_c0_seq1:33-2171(-)
MSLMDSRSMDIRQLKCSVSKASPTEDQSTYRYHVVIQYGSARWEVTKRFSEFDNLLSALSSAKYAGLPKMPSKTLLGAPTDSAAITQRKEQLRILMYDLLIRPDIRTSQALRSFLAFDSHTDLMLRSLQPDLVRTFEDLRFGVSGLVCAATSNVVLISHEDSSHLSRLGRVWSVVEPDELGALHIWTLGKDASWKRAYSANYAIKARCVCWEETTRQVFVGLEDGKVQVLSLPAETLKPQKVADMELHHRNPVTHLSCTPKRVLSLGFDAAMRVVDVRTRELLCGGRLVKRLKNESEYLTCGMLEDQDARVFIGTSGEAMLIFDISSNPPRFLHSMDLGSGPVAEIRMSQSSSSLSSSPPQLLIAHGDCVSVMSWESKGSEIRMSRVACLKSKHLILGEVNIMSVGVAPERKLIFGGYSDGSLAFWSHREGESFCVMQAHDMETTKIEWIETAPWGPILMTGGGDGRVRTWNLPICNEEDNTLWVPQAVDGEAPVASLSLGMDNQMQNPMDDILAPISGSGLDSFGVPSSGDSFGVPSGGGFSAPTNGPPISNLGLDTGRPLDLGLGAGATLDDLGLGDDSDPLGLGGSSAPLGSSTSYTASAPISAPAYTGFEAPLSAAPLSSNKGFEDDDLLGGSDILGGGGSFGASPSQPTYTTTATSGGYSSAAPPAGQYASATLSTKQENPAARNVNTQALKGPDDDSDDELLGAFR